MQIFLRRNKNILTNWWWTIDKPLLISIITLMILGVFLSFSASPAVANRNGFGSYHFVIRHIIFAPTAFAIMIAISMQKLKTIRRFALIGFIIAIFLVMFTIFYSEANKGATRWIRLFGFSLQPSEFIKPFFIITAAWLFDGQRKNPDFPGNRLSLILFLITFILVLQQPDVGMSFAIATVWAFQYSLAGLSFFIVFILIFSFFVFITMAYFIFPHFNTRIQQFIAADGEVSYQMKKSIQAIESGSLFGRGPGEGIVRSHIPDAHTDFIYSVIAEEYGFFLCLLIVFLYGVIVIRSMFFSLKETNLFITLSISGLAASFGIQSLINMASTLNLIPTKGMTLPLISYGGSSLLATGVGLGMLLAITRKNIYAEDKDEV